jgi:hypothetical protein
MSSDLSEPTAGEEKGSLFMLVWIIATFPVGILIFVLWLLDHLNIAFVVYLFLPVFFFIAMIPAAIIMLIPSVIIWAGIRGVRALRRGRRSPVVATAPPATSSLHPVTWFAPLATPVSGAYRFALDEDNDTEEWWPAARARADVPPELIPLLFDDSEVVVVTMPRAMLVAAWCETVPGWHDPMAPRKAPHPLLITHFGALTPPARHPQTSA